MNPPAETLQLSQEEQGRLLARVYAFILSDQFIVTSQEPPTIPDTKSTRKSQIQSPGEIQAIDAAKIQNHEPVL